MNHTADDTAEIIEDGDTVRLASGIGPGDLAVARSECGQYRAGPATVVRVTRSPTPTPVNCARFRSITATRSCARSSAALNQRPSDSW